MTAPKRRWFRFSLRTMFVVVTVLCVWLGYQLNWIRQRRDFYVRYNGRFTTEPFNGSAPGVLWLFGETGWPHMGLKVQSTDMDSLTEADWQLVRRARQLFPEAANNPIWLFGKTGLGDWATTDRHLAPHYPTLPSP